MKFCGAIIKLSKEDTQLLKLLGSLQENGDRGICFAFISKDVLMGKIKKSEHRTMIMYSVAYINEYIN